LTFHGVGKIRVRALLNFLSARKGSHMKPPERKRVQEKMLRQTLLHAYETIPFYHTKFRGAGIKPSDIRNIEDLTLIPATNKSEIQATPLKEMVARNAAIKECVQNRSSGSTGVPLLTLEDRNAVDHAAAAWLRFYLEIGVRLWDKQAIIKDPRHFPKKTSLTQKLGIMETKYVSVFDDAEQQLAFLEKHKPQVLSGHPADLASLANACEHNQSDFRPRMVLSFGELLDEVFRQAVVSAFGSKPFDYYGCSELNLMAWECREHDGYHINSDTLLLEFVDDGDTVTPGERGEIVGTTLVNNAMPLIRYRVGDIGVPIEKQCLCGVTLPMMKLLQGRAEDFLVATDGRAISPSAFDYPSRFLGNLERIRQFRVIQEARDRLIIQLAVREKLDNQTFERARKEIQKLLGSDMQVEFQVVDKIDKDPSGKLRSVISRLTSKSPD
jgi:phenylacetate-CoA ligase